MERQQRTGPVYTVTVHPTSGGGAIVHKRGTDERSGALLAHEIATLSRLRHPGVIEPIPGDAHEETGPVLRTHLAGRSTLVDQPPVDEAELISTGSQVAATLSDLHEQGWAHGAITAEHIIVAHDGRVVLSSSVEPAR